MAVSWLKEPFEREYGSGYISFLVAQLIKNCRNAEDRFDPPGCKTPGARNRNFSSNFCLEKSMDREEPGRLQSASAGHELCTCFHYGSEK